METPTNVQIAKAPFIKLPTTQEEATALKEAFVQACARFSQQTPPPTIIRTNNGS